MNIALKYFLMMYLFLHERLHERVFHSLAVRYFGGLHPKNIFNYRSEFFINNVQSDDIVVDVACGTGRILNAISPKIKFGVGLDYDSKNIDKSRKFFSKENLIFQVADALNFDYSELKKTHKVNKAIFSHILEHIEDVPALLKNVAVNEILICVPSQENWYRQTLKSLGLRYTTDPTHFREYTRSMLQDELTASNYRIVFMGFNSEGEIVCRALLIN